MSSKKTLQPIEFHKCPTIAFQLIINVSRKKKLENWWDIAYLKESIKLSSSFTFCRSTSCPWLPNTCYLWKRKF